jgi:hypothetical protein
MPQNGRLGLEAIEQRPFVLCAQATGYGPASKLLVIAERLVASGLPCAFMGRGIAFELAKRSAGFVEIVEAEASSGSARRMIASASGVLSVMDVDFASLALRAAKPLFVVDSLAWMRRPLPAAFLAARRYWVQDFPGLRAHLSGTSPMPCIIGPIVSETDVPSPASPPRIVVCLGGYDTPYATSEDDAGYARFVVRGLLQSGLAEASDGEVLVMGGASCMERLSREYKREGVRFASLSHREAALARGGAEIVLTAPGLTSTLECFRAGPATFFLPPQNYSQWMILHRLREAGLAPCSFHWQDHLPRGAFSPVWTLAERVPMIRRAIRQVTGDGAAYRVYVERLEQIRNVPKAGLSQKQREFFDSLGPNGAEAIAEELTAFL